MGAQRLFVVSCRYCREPVVRVPRLDTEELEALLKHLRKCQPGALVVDPPRLESLLHHFHVRPVWAPT